MQKLVSIYLWGEGNSDRYVQEHLKDELANGWHVESVTISAATASNSTSYSEDGQSPNTASAWAMVLLKK